jgi:hypothetical protein
MTKWIGFVLAGALLVGACTQPAADGGSPTPTSVSPTESPSVAPTGTLLADGTPLPDGCAGAAAASQTVAFVAEGRAWALDPGTGDLACLFPVEDAGPFAWGPQGDRVLLGDFEIRGVSADAPDLPAVDTSFGAFDWGHPLGLAVAFADRKGAPRKRLVDEGGRLIRLASLPLGKYLEVAYHPSGLALAFVIEDEEGQAIWLSTNEGEDPQRLVFSEVGTKFTSIAFTPNGRALWWTADHRQGYTEMHWMNLDDRTGFGTGWRGPIPSNADNLRLATGGRLKSVDEGTGCGDRQALIVEGDSTSPALPDETLPTSALGWLDRTTVLVAAGGCDDPLDLYAVDATGEDEPALLVLDVEQAAPRTQVTNPPRSVPVPPVEEEPPPEGVG